MSGSLCRDGSACYGYSGDALIGPLREEKPDPAVPCVDEGPCAMCCHRREFLVARVYCRHAGRHRYQ